MPQEKTSEQKTLTERSKTLIGDPLLKAVGLIEFVKPQSSQGNIREIIAKGECSVKIPSKLQSLGRE